MKKIIALTCLLSAFVLNAKAEIKTGILTQQKKVAEVEIQEGEVAEILYFKYYMYQSELGAVYFEKEGIRTVVLRSRLSSLPANSKFAGPGKLIFEQIHNDNSSDKFVVYTIEILPNSYGGGKNSGNNVTVLPKGAENMTLILESSDDMVNWTEDTVGDKPKGNRNKFYRLRAVKK
jgi:hypothetical protein